jgi:hypothetical protein
MRFCNFDTDGNQDLSPVGPAVRILHLFAFARAKGTVFTLRTVRESDNVSRVIAGPFFVEPDQPLRLPYSSKGYAETDVGAKLVLEYVGDSPTNASILCGVEE